MNGTADIVVGSAGSGRGVYLGLLYTALPGPFNNFELRSGPADRLLERAVNWAANGGGGAGNQAPTDVTLSGGAGHDWFLAGAIDLVPGLTADETRTGL